MVHHYWAGDFFARHFPEEPCQVATCNSWLLDDQLATFLPPTANIIRFQQSFRRVPGGNVCDADVIRFIFRRPTTELDDLPQRTTLERAIVRHLRAGGHWYSRSGWLALQVKVQATSASAVAPGSTPRRH